MLGVRNCNPIFDSSLFIVTTQTQLAFQAFQFPSSAQQGGVSPQNMGASNISQTPPTPPALVKKHVWFDVEIGSYLWVESQIGKSRASIVLLEVGHRMDAALLRSISSDVPALIRSRFYIKSTIDLMMI